MTGVGAELKIELLQIREAPASISTEGKRKKTYPKGILTSFFELESINTPLDRRGSGNKQSITTVGR